MDLLEGDEEALVADDLLARAECETVRESGVVELALWVCRTRDIFKFILRSF